jgi:hypothetical protein
LLLLSLLGGEELGELRELPPLSGPPELGLVDEGL